MVAPDKEGELADEVEGDEAHQVVKSTFQNLEKAKYNPVG